jgi:thioesterase domain-containing protein/acyl carrier protein
LLAKAKRRIQAPRRGCRLGDPSGNPADLETRAKLEAELLARRRRAKVREPIRKADHVLPVPLAPAQHRIWFSEMIQDNQVFNVVQAVRLSGKLDRDSLVRAFDDVVARHEPLRSVIVAEGGVARMMPSQVLPRLSLEKTACEADRGRQIERLLDETAELPFDLSTEPPIRSRLLQFDDEDHLFVTVIHHVACDEWSVRIFNDEIESFYKAHTQGVPASVPELKIRYSDYASWQNAELSGGRWEPSFEYWRSQLAGADTEFMLPGASVRGPRHRGNTAELGFELDPQESSALDSIGRAGGATAFMTMLAITMATLHGRSGERDIAIVTQIAGRNRPELANLIGVFTNTIVVRTRCDDDPAFIEFLAAVRDQVIAALTHADYPFDRLVRQLPSLRSKADVMPFGRIMFRHRQQFRPVLAASGLGSKPVKYTRGTPKFDLGIVIIDDGEKRFVRLQHDTAILDTVALEPFGLDLRRVVSAIIQDQNIRLSQLFINRNPADAGPQTAHEHAKVQPQDVISEEVSAIEARLIDICSAVLKVRTIDKNASFFDLGGDSLSILEFLFKIDEAFGVNLAMNDVFRNPTIKAIAGLIPGAPSRRQEVSQHERCEDKLVTPLLPKDSRAAGSRNIFLVPGAADIPLRFSGVARRLSAKWYGWGIVHPEMVPGERKPESLTAIASRMREGIERVDPKGPYLLAGYSYGGFVAYEIARQLSNSGKTAGVVLLDTRFRLSSPMQRFQKRFRILLRKSELMSKAVGAVRKVRRRIPFSRLTTLQKAEADLELRLTSRKPGPWHELIMNSQRMLVRNYRPSSSLVPVVLIRASQSVRRSDYQDYGWSVVAKVLAVMPTAGNHVTFFQARNEESFCLCFDRALDRLSSELLK